VGVETYSVVSIKIMVFGAVGTLKMKVQIPPKCLYLFTTLCDVILQKTVCWFFNL